MAIVLGRAGKFAGKKFAGNLNGIFTGVLTGVVFGRRIVPPHSIQAIDSTGRGEAAPDRRREHGHHEHNVDIHAKWLRQAPKPS